MKEHEHDITVTTQFKIHWRTPPSTMGARIAREHAQKQLDKKAFGFSEAIRTLLERTVIIPEDS